MSLPNTFSPADLAASSGNFNTEQLLLTLDANTVSQQPDIVVSEVPGLSAHQLSARQTASFFLSEVTPDVTGVNSAVIGFANQFLAFCPHLLTLAQVIDDAAATAARRQECAAQFAEGLTALSANISRGQPQRDTTTSNLGSLGLRLEQNTTALDADMALARKYLEEGTLKQLEAQLATVQDALARDNSTVANGAVKGLVSALQITIGIALAYEKPGEGIKLAVSGIEGAVVVGEEQKEAMADLHKQFAAYQELMARLGGARVAYAGVQNVSHAVDLMTHHQHTAQVALEGVTTCWKDLDSRLQGLARTLSTTVPSNLQLTAQLDAAASAWRGFKDQMVRWQADGAHVPPGMRFRLG